MKILLIGEYSGLYNNLRDGLRALGNEVVLASTGDGFKAFPSDISFGNGSLRGKMILLYTLLTKRKLFKGYDAVFLVNAKFINNLFITKWFYNFILRNNKSIFLSAAGDDSIYFEYWLKNPYEEFNLYFQDLKKYDGYVHSKKWGNARTIIWNKKLIKLVNGVIPIMYEYHLPYINFSNCYSSIPIPINVDKIPYSKNNIENNKIVIFHGLNRIGAKGTIYIQKAFSILKDKYPDDLELIIDGHMSFERYQEIIKRVNIVVDQTHSHSLAVNALVSMAMSKVVLGGATPLAFEEMKYQFNPAINISSTTESIISAVEFLIQNKMMIPEIGYQSRLFVEKHHHYISVARSYVDCINKYNNLKDNS